MQTVTKEAFETFLANTLTHSEPTVSRDNDYAYETWTDFDDNEVAFITYSNGEVVSYHIEG